MRVISNKRLVDFADRHRDARVPLQIWRKAVEATVVDNFAELKRMFRSVDRVGDFYVFDIGGNKFRIIAAIHFNRRMIFVRNVLTHKEYDSWRP